jgi:glycosyltransferase involved in cell wall biosynthesis
MSESHPVVSVIMVTYNHRNYLRQAAESVLNQRTTFPFELIIGEDGSEDGTAEVCRELEREHPHKVRVFYRSRKDVITIEGMPTGRFNVTECMKAARGKYIALCEGDDYWQDMEKLEKQVRFLESNPGYVLSCHDACVVSDDGSVRDGSRLKPEEKKDLSSEDLLRGGYVLTLSILYRNIFTTFPPEFFRVNNGDLFLTVLLGEKGHGKFQSEIKPAAYRFHQGGVWSLQAPAHRRRRAANSAFWIARYFRRTGKPELFGHYVQSGISQYMDVIRLYRVQGEWKDVFLTAWKVSWYYLRFQPLKEWARVCYRMLRIMIKPPY